jgi:predicted metal-dependent phosphoesterase TrpH
VHTNRSVGGELTPAEVTAAARTAGLDFIAVTEHNTTDTYDAFRALAGDGLLVIRGQEATTLTGHWLALGIEPGQVIDGQYGVRDSLLERQLDEVRRVGGLCVAAHPYAPYPSGTFMYPLDGFDLVEVWNGPWSPDRPWNADNETALAEWGRELAAGVHRGYWRPAVANSDTHLAGQMGVPHNVVPAAELSAKAILGGLRAGRNWMTDSAAISLSFRVSAGGRSAGIGARLELGDEPAVVRLAVSGLPAGTVSLHTERGMPYREPLPASGVVEWPTDVASSGFVRAEVRHPDNRMAALTNPIILT